MHRANAHGQPVGAPLGGWKPPAPLEGTRLEGAYVSLEPLQPNHATSLFGAFGNDASLWTYMAIGPFGDEKQLRAALEVMLDADGWTPYAAVVDGIPLGILSYLRDQPRDGVIEIGSIVFGPDMQRTRSATEAVHLMLRHAFESGYRRVEWKCDDLNEPSRRAAVRLGFTYEGTFRQATHYKGRNRDTAWYATIDSSWPDVDSAHRAWLAPGNFDEEGLQRMRLQPPTRSEHQ